MRKHCLYFILYDIFPYQCKQTCTYTSPIKKKKKKSVHTLACQTASERIS